MKRKVAVVLCLILNVAFAEQKKFCAAVRGNGEAMLAHFGSLARLTETYGVLDGIAGGSSGSITAFLYESLMLNPAVNNCKGVPCTKEERARRVALFLKAGPEIIEVMKKTPEALAVKQIAGLQQEVKTKGIAKLFEEGKVKEAGDALKTLLESKEFRSMINPDMYRLISLGRGREVYEQIANYGKWKVEDPSPFFRPGFINFSAAPDIFGKVADFYAGRGPVNEKAMSDMLDGCAGTDSIGRDWESLKTGCKTDFNALYKDYRTKYDKAPAFNHRKEDGVGEKLPALISTSVLDGKTPSDLWRKNMAEFWRTPNAKYDFKPGFDRVKFGYWGRNKDLKKVQKGLEGSTDLKAQKFLSLGPAKWKDVLNKSPAEPGIANGQEINENHVSLGGWSDLHPVQALKAMGCKNVVYVTRRGPESTFAVSVARQLGMTQAEEDKLYTLKSDGEPSSYQSAIRMADAVFCTDWNKSSVSDVMAMSRDAYNAPLVSRSEFFKKPLQGSTKELVPSLKVEGCDGETGSPPPAERERPAFLPGHY